MIDYIVNKPNPIFQSFYFVMAGGGFFVYVKEGFVKFCPGPYLDGYHRTIGSMIMAICYYTFYKASKSDPGVIKSVPKFHEKYDEIMYTSNN